MKPTEVTYEINGKTLRKIIDSVGIRQVDLADACGHPDGTRICNMLRKGVHKVKGSTMAPIVNLLRKKGVEVEGFHG